MSSPLKFLDLFAGAGGLSEGFIRAGFKPVAHVEADGSACYTLKTRQAFHWLKKNNALDIYSKYLKNEIKGNETILFKGSQYLEGIIADLLEDKSNIKNLPRQDEAAKKRRAKWGLK